MTTWCDTKTAVQVVESGNRVFLPGRCTTPTPLIEALVARGEELRDVEILGGLLFPAAISLPLCQHYLGGLPLFRGNTAKNYRQVGTLKLI